MTDGARGPLTLRVALSARTLGLAVAVALGVVAAWNVLVSARAIIATAVAAAVVAVLLTGPVEWLARRVRRPVAVVLTLIAVVGGVGGLVWRVYDDLDRAFERLQDVAPDAARELERSERVGEVARDLRLAERVETAVDQIREGARERARQAAFRAASFFVAGILTVFLLIYGPRMIEGGIAQVEDPIRRDRVRRVIESSSARARRYLGGVIAQGLVVAGISFGAFRLVDLPASVALAAVVGVASVVPYVGVVAGFVPALLLSGAFEPASSTVVLSLLAAALQVASVATVRELSRRAMYAGPALTLFAVLIGFDVYGPGGAVFGMALAVFAIAVAEAAGADKPDEPADPVRVPAA